MQILMQTRVGAGRDLVAEAPTQSSERQSGPGEGLPAAASWEGEAAVLSPRLKPLLQARARLLGGVCSITGAARQALVTALAHTLPAVGG